MNTTALLRDRWARLDALPDSEYPERFVHHVETRRLFNAAICGELLMADESDIDETFDPFGLLGGAT